MEAARCNDHPEAAEDIRHHRLVWEGGHRSNCLGVMVGVHFDNRSLLQVEGRIDLEAVDLHDQMAWEEVQS